MRNPMYKLYSAKAGSILRVLFAMVALTSIMATSALSQATSTNGGANSVICAIVNVYNTVVTAIFVIGIMLMILGGALYAGSHLMPGSTKGTMQGYGMGMVLGGVIGIIIAVLAPFILNVITGNTATQAVSGASSFSGC
jgi:hypothetical protein